MFGLAPIWMNKHPFSSQTSFFRFVVIAYFLLTFSQISSLKTWELFSAFLSSIFLCKGSAALSLKCLFLPSFSSCWSSLTTLIWVWMQKQTPIERSLSSVVPVSFVCLSPIIFIKWCLALVGFVFLYVLHPHWIIHRCQAMFALCSIFPQHLVLYLVQ